jgi:hypothetical protein
LECIVLLKEVLQHEIVDHLRGKGMDDSLRLDQILFLPIILVAEHINDQIEEQVRVQVEEQLTNHIPATLQEQVEDHRRQLDDVKRALHNS